VQRQIDECVADDQLRGRP